MCENKYRCVVIDKQFQNCFIEIKIFDWLIIENKQKVYFVHALVQ